VVKLSWVWLADEEELTMATRITKADRLRANEAARHDGRDGLADLLDAKPVKPTKRKKQ
jgi:hypothetical protein